MTIFESSMRSPDEIILSERDGQTSYVRVLTLEEAQCLVLDLTESISDAVHQGNADRLRQPLRPHRAPGVVQ
jgi:hypothetical protein